MRIPLVVALAVVTVLLVRQSTLRPLHAAPCVLVGFLLAETPLAPGIDDAVRTLVEALAL